MSWNVGSVSIQHDGEVSRCADESARCARSLFSFKEKGEGVESGAPQVISSYGNRYIFICSRL